MDEKKEKTIGILGGMGPEATVDLIRKIIEATPIEKEQDHCRIIIDNNPKIPSRTDSILSGDTAEVRSVLCATALNLQNAGADFIAMPCNTAHYFIKDVRESVNISVINMLEETALFIRSAFPEMKKAGILGTTATVKLELYQNALAAIGIGAVIPAKEEQIRVMEAIMLIKENGNRQKAKSSLVEAAGGLALRGADIIIAGCTEIPLVLSASDVGAPLIDPAKILAARAVEMAKGARRRSLP